jgi:hypothetical protein
VLELPEVECQDSPSAVCSGFGRIELADKRYTPASEFDADRPALKQPSTKGGSSPSRRQPAKSDVIFRRLWHYWLRVVCLSARPPFHPVQSTGCARYQSLYIVGHARRGAAFLSHPFAPSLSISLETTTTPSLPPTSGTLAWGLCNAGQCCDERPKANTKKS